MVKYREMLYFICGIQLVLSGCNTNPSLNLSGCSLISHSQVLVIFVLLRSLAGSLVAKIQAQGTT